MYIGYGTGYVKGLASSDRFCFDSAGLNCFNKDNL